MKVKRIKASLQWLGMNWDEGIDVGGNNGPYRQTERLDLYKEVTQRLLDEGKAYECYCTPGRVRMRCVKIKWIVGKHQNTTVIVNT